MVSKMIDREEDIQQAAQAIKAIAHPLRLKILCVLGDQEVSVQDIVEQVGTSQSNISQHLAILRDKGVLATRKDANRVYYRIDDLRQTSAAVKFLSLEPLLGHLRSLKLKGIDWVIVGGESGPGARPIEQSWVIEIRDQCRNASVPFFFKQWGGTNRKKTGRLLEGRTWDEVPRDTCVETRHAVSAI